MPDDRHEPCMTPVTPTEPGSLPRSHRSGEPATASRHAVRSTPWVRLEIAAASARGRHRERNEDWHSAAEGSAPVFVVADGVGGGAMAAQASRELVARLHDALDGRRIDAGLIRNALLHADHEIGRSIASRTASSGAATVALAAGSGPLLSRWLVAWVGDCRVYRVGARQEGPAELLTVDDTYRHLREAPPPGGSRDDPARMIGNGAVCAPNVREVALRRGEMLALCSDGLHRHVDARDLARVLHGPAPLARRCEGLLALARKRGSSDDATVLVVRREPRLGWLGAGAAMFAVLFAALVVTRLL